MIGKIPHLQVHTCYSLLEAYVKIEELFVEAKKLGISSLALTDKNNMFAAVKFYTEAKKQGIKAIIGAQVTVQSLLGRQHSELLLYAKNDEGYKHLCTLLSRAYENHEFEPFVSLAELAEYAEGLICVVGIRGSDLYEALLYDYAQEQMEIAMAYLGIFGSEHLYLALSGGMGEEEDSLISKKVAFSKMSGIRLLALNEIYYLRREEAVYQDLLNCIKTGNSIQDKRRPKLPSESYYMYSAEEMKQKYLFCPEALLNAEKLAEVCKFDFDFTSYHMPLFEGKEPSHIALKKACLKGLKKRYGIAFDRDGSLLASAKTGDPKTDEGLTQTILERLKYELEVIGNMGFEDYFLICQDYVAFAKGAGIIVGPGRGSGGGSITCYLLEITDIDPIEHGLLFERFLNPERIDMPDLDIDFQDDRRSEVLDYVSQKYGRDRVAQIITFGTLSARQVIRDVGRVMGLSVEKLNRVSALVPKTLDITLEKALETESKLKELYLKNNEVKELINCSKALEGLPRHSSIHAAGVIISKEKLNEILPTIVKTQVCTQYDMNDIKNLGLLKMDFLSLKKLSIISQVLRLLKGDSSFDFKRFENEFADEKTFRLLSEGKNVGIFQLESVGMMKFFSQLKPKNLEDIVIGISIFRPGPSVFIPTLLRNRENPKAIFYEHPLLKPILEKTYACLVYQEQVIEIARVLAGFSYGRADKIRRAMSKKDMKIMEEEERNFIYGNRALGIKGALANGVNEKLAKEIYRKISDFAKYAFNKSHAVAYAIIAYRMAYLKANYPLAFMVSLLNSELHANEKTRLYKYLEEALNLQIEVLPPSVKKSGSSFRIEGKAIRYSLSAIKYLGSNVVKEVEYLQQAGTFPSSLEDFYRKMPAESLNRKTIEALCFSGALDEYGVNRASVLHNYERMHQQLSSPTHKRDSAQISLEDFVGMDAGRRHFEVEQVPDYEANFLQEKTLEFCGMLFLKSGRGSDEKELYLRMPNFGRADRELIDSLPLSEAGFALIVFEEKKGRYRKFHKKIDLNRKILDILKAKYGKDNVKVKK